MNGALPGGFFRVGGSGGHRCGARDVGALSCSALGQLIRTFLERSLIVTLPGMTVLGYVSGCVEKHPPCYI